MPTSNDDPVLIELCSRALSRRVTLPSRELFSLNGKPLPCWREEDIDPNDDWLLTDQYYPLYYRLFQEAAVLYKQPRMLEIGVRTGYIGVVFARAVGGSSYYIGVDPNQYLPDGLDRARQSFTSIQNAIPQFTFSCIVGYSGDAKIQAQLQQQAPYDVIHIDGDHTLQGKLIDLDLARSWISPTGLVLVDDYHHLPDIMHEAVGRALRLGWYTKFAVLNTCRGLIILQK